MFVNPNHILKLRKMTVFKERQNKTYKSITQGKKKPTFGGLVGRPSLQDPFSVQNAVVLQGRSSNFVLPQTTNSSDRSNDRETKEKL